MREKITPVLTELEDGIAFFDFYDRNIKDRTSGYLIEGKKLALVEAGPGPSGGLVLNALAQKGYAPEDLAYVIVTHLHLDHAGAAGYILQKCPQAQLVVHPRGARFLIDPTALVEGSRDFFPDFEEMMLPVYPVPEDRIISIEDNGVIDLGDRSLVFMHGEGHSRTHFTLWDSMTNGIFCGDMAGLIYPEIETQGITFCLPASVPNQFDPLAFKRSVEKLQSLKPDKLYFSHFGPSKSRPDLYFDICLSLLPLAVQAAEEIMGGDKSRATWQHVAQRLHEIAAAELQKIGLPQDRPIPALLEHDIINNAQGLVDWWKRKQG